MCDIERISKKIAEEKDNLVAKAFTAQIASLLLTNGIVPIMTEYRKQDLESITDTDRYKLVYELGVTFDRLDTTDHDKQVRADERAEVIAEISREMRLLYGNEYEQKVRADAIDEFAEDIINKIYFEEKWLFDCKSNNADTDIMISALKTFVKSRAEQLKEISNCSKDTKTLAKICEIQTNQFVDSYIKNFDNHFDTSKIGFKKASRKPNIHELKILPEYFNEVQSHNKQFEQRKDELIIHIMHGYDTIQAPNGDVCFGCYDPKTKEIYVADDIPKEALFHTIAHEYKHYLQDIEGKEFSEEEAEEYADSIFNCDTEVKIDQDKTILEKFIKNVLTRLNELAEDSEYYFDKDNANFVSSVMYECEVALERGKNKWQQ